MHFKIPILWILLTLCSLLIAVTAFAKTISDTTESTIEFAPIDYETHGEDVTWDVWLKRDADKFEGIREGWSDFSEKYRNDLLKNANKSSYREKSFGQKDGTEYTSKMIVGTKTPNGISYTSNNIKLGGVKLSRVKSVLHEGSAEGIFIENGKAFLASAQSNLNSQNDRFPDDLLIIMKSVFESHDGGPWQTIDPPQNPQLQKTYGEVKYGSYIANTHVGEVMFEADRLMKIFGLGYDNRTGTKLLLPLWHKTQWDFMTDSDTQQISNNWSRFWFTTEETIVEIDTVNKVARISGRPLMIKTEKMIMDGGTLQTSAVQTGDAFSDQWCRFFDQNFDKYKEQYTVFSELEKLARIASIFQGLKECGVIFQDITLPDTGKTDTATRTAVISALKTRTVKDQSGNRISTSQMILNLIGGVGMQKVRFLSKDLSAYKSGLIGDYNAGKTNVERIF